MYSLSRFRRPDLTRLAALGLVSILVSGCSMPMGSLIGGGDDKPDVTGTAAPADGRATALGQAPDGGVQLATAQPSGTNPLSPTDWTYARGALGLALTSTQSGPPVPWANPETGTRGNFAPVAAAIEDGGRTCRDFVATRTENGREVQLQGRACRTPDGQWDIAETTKTAL